MKIKGFHVGIIAAAALLSLVLFFVGQSLYQRHFVLNPILKELGAIKGVEGVQVLPAGEGKAFAFQLAAGADLARVYGEIEGKLRESFRKGTHTIILRDRRNKDLDVLYHRVHFAVYEAIARGNFVSLAEKVAEEARSSGVEDYRLTIDSKRVYLQFAQDGYYLYEVIPRQGEDRG